MRTHFGLALPGTLAVVFALSAPAPARAQSADYAGPAVVPPADSYVAATETEAAIPRWSTDAESERVLHVHFMDPPPTRPDFWAEAARALDA